MDLDKLVSDLAKERDRLGRAISALLGSASAALSGGGKKKRVGRPKGTTMKKRKRGGLTPGRQKASVNCDEEALGRAQEE